MIQRIKNNSMPQFMFEWHPISSKVYWMRVPVPENGEVIESAKIQAYILGEHCDNHAQAFLLVQAFCRGYLAFKEELQKSKEPKPTIVGVS